MDGERGISVTISVDGTSSLHVSSWNSNTDPSASVISGKSFFSKVGSSVDISSIASSRRFDVYNPTFID